MIGEAHGRCPRCGDVAPTHFLWCHRLDAVEKGLQRLEVAQRPERTEPVIPRRQPGRATITVGSKVLFDGEVYAVEEVGEHGLSVRLVAVKP